MPPVTATAVELPDGETIHYRRRAGGEIPVVLLHGNNSSSKHWDVVLERTDGRFDLIAMDMRGFGDSSYRQPVDSLADLAADVRRFADAIDLDAFHLWGWSLGAGVATQVAADVPGRVGRLVLMAPPGTQGLPVYERDADLQPTGTVLETRAELAEDPVSVAPVLRALETGDEELIKQIWERAIFVHGPPEAERFDAYAAESLKQRNFLDVTYALAHFNISHEHDGLGPGTGEVDRVDAKTLVIRGEDDLVVTRGMSERVVAEVEDAQFVELAACGHAPTVDAPERLLEAVEPFLDAPV